MALNRKTWEELTSTCAPEREWIAWIGSASMAELFYILNRLAPHLPYYTLAIKAFDVRVAQLGRKRANWAIRISVAAFLVSLYAAIKQPTPIIIVQPQPQSSNSTADSAAKVHAASQ
jgi:hypothetical protein